MVEIFQTEYEIEVFKKELAEIERMLLNGEVGGDLAEVGVYKGGTAKLIRELPGILHLFDTFKGLPDLMTKDDAEHYEVGHMAVDKSVENMLKELPNTKVYKGVFPKTASKVKGRFAFVHIDVDIYQSTKDALEFFWPKLNIQGTMIVHDYPAHPGVTKAVDEYFEGKREGNYFIRSGFRQLIIHKR